MAESDTPSFSPDNELSNDSHNSTRGGVYLEQRSREGTLGVDTTIVGHGKDRSWPIEVQIGQEETPITSNQGNNDPKGSELLAPRAILMQDEEGGYQKAIAMGLLDPENHGTRQDTSLKTPPREEDTISTMSMHTSTSSSGKRKRISDQSLDPTFGGLRCRLDHSLDHWPSTAFASGQPN